MKVEIIILELYHDKKRRMRSLFLLFALLGSIAGLVAQDTITVQTLTYDSIGRDYYFDFPADDGTTYSQILMEYSMRCHDARVSTGSNRNLGCGEWDYSCNTYIVDESRQDSTKATHPSHILGGWAESELPYVVGPTYDYYERGTQFGVATDLANSVEVSIANGEDISLALANGTKRVRQLFDASILIASGLQAGPIHGLRLPTSVDNTLGELRLNLQPTTTQSFFNLPIEELGPGMFNHEISTGSDGTEIWFCEPVEWDGSSTLMLDLAIANPERLQLDIRETPGAAMHTQMFTTKKNQYLQLDGNTYYEVANDRLGEIDKEVTVEFWAYGNTMSHPLNNSILEGVNGNNQRELNIHLPWSNGQVYWDCGNEGGYDRINKVVPPEVYRGSWHHWAFTKDANAGTMAIYLDGQLFHSGSGMTRSIDLDRLNLGANQAGGNHYPGLIDEVRIYNKALLQSQIEQNMRRALEDNAFSGRIDEELLYAFEMNGDGQDLVDIRGSMASHREGSTRRLGYRVDESINGFVQNDAIYALTFLQGGVSIDCETGTVIDPVEQSPVAVDQYAVVGTDIVLDSAYSVYAATAETTYSPEGAIVSSEPIDPENSITVSQLDYYRKNPMRFEIMSFVTPYGIFLDLGEEGRTWTFDMTDFTPILKGRKRMFLGNGGQNQEEMDIRFHFIKGTPTRDVLDIQQIWRPGDQCNNANIKADNCFEPRMIVPKADASYLKVRSMVTGHGQEGEFIPRTHFININGLPEIDWRAWKECSENPVYPQGGTWIFDRAGWCPGMATDLQEWDLQDYLEPGEPFEIDYDMANAGGDSRYLVNHQLVSYGPFNYNYDLAINAVKVPSDRVEYGRYNPTCDQPSIVVSNQGEETITSATFEYTVGGVTETYTWTGQLRSLRTRTIALPAPSLETFANIPPGKSSFLVEVVSINGGDNTDERSGNDIYRSSFEMPAMYDAEEYVIQLRSNNIGAQNSITVTDYDGNALLSRNTLLNNQNYRDTLILDPGCYTIELFDRGDNGLEFFAQPNEGAGAMRLRGDNRTLIDFEEDFGRTLRYSFVVAEVTNVTESLTPAKVEVYPNPTSDRLYVKMEAFEDKVQEIIITDAYGSTMHIHSVEHRSPVADFNVQSLPAGVYFVSLISDRQELTTTRFIKL